MSQPLPRKDRFSVSYSLSAASRKEAREIAFGICVEQTVEFPYDLIDRAEIRERIVGRIEALSAAGQRRYRVEISYADETAAGELTQWLNVVFGNTSLKPAIRVENLTLSPALLSIFRGPVFGISGLRRLTRTQRKPRPLVCSALKPMGLSSRELASLAHCFARGGIDIIKDDHGLSNQPMAPFEERVAACAAAVAEANREINGRCLYAPNITADSEAEALRRARFAREKGAGALVVSPGLTGMNLVRILSAQEDIHLPILFHPALLGSFTASPDSGLSHGVLYGQLPRLLGADAVIFPNFGGRFSSSRADCRAIAQACRADLGRIKPILPAPGGGMDLPRIPGLTRFYGPDVIFLMGGGLFRHSTDLVESTRAFRQAIEPG